MTYPGFPARGTVLNEVAVARPQQRALSRPTTVSLTGILAVGGVAILSLATGDWLLGLAVAVLLVGWAVLGRGEHPPVVAAAFTYQWAQVTIALFYFLITGRKVPQMELIDYRPIVLVGLASVTAMFAGYYLSSPRKRIAQWQGPMDSTGNTSLGHIPLIYGVTVAASGAIQAFAWSFPMLTQVLLVVSYTRFVFLYLLVSRLLGPRPRWLWLSVVLCVELAIGFTGFFANFREPLAMIALAVIGTPHTQRATKWAVFAILVGVAFAAAVTWTAIKPLVRVRYSYSASATERLSTAARMITPALAKSGGRWEPQVDNLVSRMWAVYYPALALERVPKVIPYTNGTLLRDAVRNLATPRVLFPDKGILPSESEKVRKYAGVWVAGRETKTSYAFGYTAESYVDFGWPLMLVPIFLFGFIVGLADRMVLNSIRSDEIRTGVRVLVLWLSLYQFEVSWVMLIGFTTVLFAVMGGGTLFIERFIFPPLSEPDDKSPRLAWMGRTNQRRFQPPASNKI